MQATIGGQLWRLARGIGIYGLGQVLTQLGAFLLLPLFTRHLSKADYGVVGLLAAFSFIATPIFSLGFGTATGPCYFEGGRDERKAATIWTSFVILLLSTSVLAVLSLAMPAALSTLALGTPDLAWLVTLTLFTSIFEILSMPGRFRVQFEERAGLFIAVTVTSSLSAILLSAFLVVGLGRGALGVVEGRLAGQALAFGLFSMATLPALRFHIDIDLGRELLRLGLPLVPSFLFLVILQQGNRYILQWTRGLDAVGLYTVGHNLGQAMSLVIGAFQAAWFPFFMSFIDRREEARLLFGRVLTYYVLGAGSLSLLFFVFARPVTLVMTQPEFHEAYRVVGLVACGLFLSTAFLVLLPGVYFAKEVKVVSLVQACGAALGVALTVALTRLLGFVGAGLGLAGGYLSLSVLQLLWNWKRRDRYLVIDYEWARILRFILLYFVYAVALTWPRGWSLATEAVASTTSAIVLVIVVFRLLTPRERDALWRLFKSKAGHAEPR